MLAASATPPLPPADLWRCLTPCVRVQALWKGNGVTMVHRLPYSAINFFTYEHLLRHLSGTGFDEAAEARDAGTALTPAGVRHRLAAGAGAGLVACASTYPLDLVRTRLATQTTTNIRYTGMRHALRSIYAEEGALGLYRGLGATLVGPVFGHQLCSLRRAAEACHTQGAVSTARGAGHGCRLCRGGGVCPVLLPSRPGAQTHAAGGCARDCAL